MATHPTLAAARSIANHPTDSAAAKSAKLATLWYEEVEGGGDAVWTLTLFELVALHDVDGLLSLFDVEYWEEDEA